MSAEISNATLRILLVDDHEMVVSAMRLLMECQPGLNVVGEAGDRARALELAGQEQPDVILLDLCLGQDNGVDLIPELLEVAGHARIILLTGVHEPQEFQRAIRKGAMGVVTKGASAAHLLKAIERVHAGELWLNRSMTANLVKDLRRDVHFRAAEPEKDAASQLTAREREVINLVGEGLRNKQIADRLCISETTVRHHLTSILKKLEVSDRVELLIFAYRNNLLNVEIKNRNVPA